MKRILVAVLCLALVQTAISQETYQQPPEEPGGGITERLLDLFFTIVMWLNTFVYRITGGRVGVEAYCF
jgi:hypothetical protein